METLSARTYNVNSVEKAVKIIQYVSDNVTSSGLSMIELQKALNIKKSTLFVLLATLVRERILNCNTDTHRYFAGNRLLEWGSAVGRQMDLKSLAPRFLQELTERTRETSHLAILDGDKIIFVDKVESPEPLKMSTSVGVRLPLHTPATAKSIVAFQNNETREMLIESINFEKQTDNTIKNADQYREVLLQVNQRGYSLDNEEIFVGTRCAAAPILNRKGIAVAAIGITAPALRFTTDKIDEMVAIIKDVAVRFSNIVQLSEENR
ncbi:MAG: IclR family transcriptional regulator [Fibrobacteres bacterium]|nr:IclR family transcriptional regulator [Fibrobacterota bacterium]